MTMKREIRGTLELEFHEERGRVGRVEGVLLPLGRVASDRAEVFVPGAVQFPSGGVKLLRGHKGVEILRFVPVVSDTEIRISAELPDDQNGRLAASEIKSGARAATSVEFFDLESSRISNTREIRSALVDAVALVARSSYSQARVELRGRRRRRWR